MEPKTSTTHPLEIDELIVGSGLLGMTLCPGKRAPSYFGGRWERDLSIDMRAVVNWGATTLVTLMEGSELERLGVGNLGAVAEAAGLEWHHLPITDVQVPDERFERPWAYSGHVLRRKLRSGERVLLHCRGGLGRTGTIAARLAIELGSQPNEALRTVRLARTGTVETPAQEDHVRACEPIRGDDAHADRVLGCMLGGAVGDALGYRVEFLSRAEIEARYGGEGIREPTLDEAGEANVSDDTQMTLFTADGLLESIGRRGQLDTADLLSAVRDATLTWYAMQEGQSPAPGASRLSRYPVLGKQQAPGTTCMGASRLGATGTPEAPINHSKGCGGVMRVAAVGLIRDLGSSQAFELATRCAAQTHGHPSGHLSAGVLAAVVRGLVEQLDLVDAVSDALAIARAWPGADETVAAVERAVELARAQERDHHEAVPQLGKGWFGDEALAIGVYSALAALDFRDAVRIASNHDGDSDSTASIAGQIHGAWKGLSGIPNAWIRRLDALDPLLDVSGRLIRTG